MTNAVTSAITADIDNRPAHVPTECPRHTPLVRRFARQLLTPVPSRGDGISGAPVTLGELDSFREAAGRRDSPAAIT